MKKRLPSLFLAPALCLVLAVPALADGEPAAEAAVTGPSGAISAEEREFVLRDVTVEMGNETKPTYVHDVLTRYAAEERRETFDEVFVLTSASGVTLSGLRTGDGSKSPLDVINVYAWSDPDGDGVYDQQVFTSKYDGGPAVVVPFSMPGPFRAYHVYNAYPWYSLSAELRADNTLYTGAYHTDQDARQPAAALSSGFLMEQFGPNTLVRLELTTRCSDATGGKDKLDGRYITLYLPETSFTDVPSWCAKEADWAAQKGITKGYGGKDKFAPGVTCSQAEILTFLHRAENKPAAESKSPFTVASYYQDAVDWAYEKGIIGDGFTPGAPCTRAQAVTYIWKARNEPEAKEAASFSDVDAGSPIAPAVLWAVEKGVTKGYGGADTFAPDRVCTRGEIACFLYRAYN